MKQRETKCTHTFQNFKYGIQKVNTGRKETGEDIQLLVEFHQLECQQHRWKDIV